jgi:hypothetical protein
MRALHAVLLIALLMPLSGCIDFFEGLWFSPDVLGADDEYAPPVWNTVPVEWIEYVQYRCLALDASAEDEEVPVLTWVWVKQCLSASDQSCVPSDHPERQRTVVVFFHGNGGNLNEEWDRIQMLWDMGYTVFAMDYRGYGKVEGTPSEEGVYQDGRASLDSVFSRLVVEATEEEPSAQALGVVYYGHSLGSAVAIQMAIDNPPMALITESAIGGAQAFTDDAIGMGLDASVFMDTRFDNIAKIPSIFRPKLIMHGEADDFVRFEFSEILFERAADPKQFYGVPEAGHGGVPCPSFEEDESDEQSHCIAEEAYIEVVSGFLDSHVL